jgi:hypothetical protein
MPCPRQIWVSPDLYNFIVKNKKEHETFGRALERLLQIE